MALVCIQIDKSLKEQLKSAKFNLELFKIRSDDGKFGKDYLLNIAIAILDESIKQIEKEGEKKNEKNFNNIKHCGNLRN